MKHNYHLAKKDFVDFFCHKKLFSNQRYFSRQPAEISLFQNMKNSKTDNIFFRFNYLLLAAISLVALVATFFVSNLNLGFEMKSVVFLAIVVVYFAAFYVLQKRQTDNLQIEAESRISESLFNAEVENKLLALEEANEFFGASLKFPDTGLSYKKFKLPPTLVGGCVFQKSAGFSRISVKNKISELASAQVMLKQKG